MKLFICGKTNKPVKIIQARSTLKKRWTTSKISLVKRLPRKKRLVKQNRVNPVENQAIVPTPPTEFVAIFQHKLLTVFSMTIYTFTPLERLSRLENIRNNMISTIIGTFKLKIT